MTKSLKPESSEEKQPSGQTEGAPEQTPEPGQADSVPAAEDALAAIIAERDELKDRLLRLAAETENYKKRSERDKADFLKRANESLLRDLLPVLDGLERAAAHAQEQNGAQGVAEGLGLLQQEFWKVLERYGLEKVEALGLPFNPEVHEAMMQQDDPEAEENTVLIELQKGYLFQGRLLRPAMVVVSKRPATAEDEGTEIPITVN